MKLRTFYFAIAACHAANLSAAQSELPDLSLNLNDVTVSGLSSGGFMANQFHIAHSDWVKGAGIIAAGPYYCAQNDITVALSSCVSKVDKAIPLDKLNAKANEYAKQGKIAPLGNLKDSKVWILHGTKDTKVVAPVSDALVEQYSNWVSQDNIRYESTMPFAHHFPTENSGSACDVSQSPFLGNCDYDAAKAMLSFLLGELDEENPSQAGTLYSIDQAKLGDKEAQSLAQSGYLFVPKACEQNNTCKLHISFHGCNQNSEAVGDQFVANNGLNRWADSNNIVVLYPQTKKSLFMPLNPQACWDWWGYADEDYATAQGTQISAVENIVRALNNKK